jgi:hypothetical protein
VLCAGSIAVQSRRRISGQKSLLVTIETSEDMNPHHREKLPEECDLSLAQIVRESTDLRITAGHGPIPSMELEFDRLHYGPKLSGGIEERLRVWCRINCLRQARTRRSNERGGID